MARTNPVIKHCDCIYNIFLPSPIFPRSPSAPFMGLPSLLLLFLFPSSSSSPSEESESFLLAAADVEAEEDEETANEAEVMVMTLCILASFSMMSSAVESESRE